VTAAEVAEPAGSATPEAQGGLLAPLRIRDFRLLWVGQTVSLLGDQFHFIALAWLTLLLTGSPLALGTVLMAAAIPRGGLMLVGGALTDRFSQRALMLLSDSLRAVLVTGLSVLVLTGNAQLWQLYVLAVIFGGVDAVFYPASQAILPSLVDEKRLGGANALSQGAMQASSLLGPVAAGALIAAFAGIRGIGIALALDAVSFYVSAFSLFLMRTRGGVVGSEGEKGPGLVRSIVDGLRYAWNDPVLRALLFAIAGVDVTAAAVFSVGLPLLARTQFSGAAAFGIMLSGFGGGALLGVLAAGMVQLPRRRGLITVGVLAVFGVGTAVLPMAPNLVVATALIAGMGAAGGFIQVLIMPWIQTRSDPSMLGRVSSLIMLASVGLTPISYAVSGWIASYNLTALFLAGAMIMLATSAYTALSPARSID
jgi:MFS family permease